MKSFFLHQRRFIIGSCHWAIIVLSLTSAYLLRFDFFIPEANWAILLQALWIVMPIKMVIFYIFGLHRGWWRLVGMGDLVRIFFANLTASACFTTATLVLVGPSFPRSVYVIDFLLCFVLTAGARFAVRLYNETLIREVNRTRDKGLLIYGAGSAGMALLKEIHSNPKLGYEVIGFVDDDPQKQKAVLMGVPVLGKGRDISSIVDLYKSHSPRIQEIVVAMPSATGRQMREVLAHCRMAGIACKTIPGIDELLNGRVLSAQIRNISHNDLLGRESVRLEESLIRGNLGGRAVLVTGAAGSIGSELCLQIAQYRPRKLIALDQAESELFKIDLKLRDRFSGVEIVAEVADIRDFRRVGDIVHRHSVDSIFHAAAYKHVPMMENHLYEAVRNNVLGTWNLVQVAYRHRVSDFLMISSDKAVNPTNIMGVTKRVAEIIVSAMQSEDAERATRFVSVRFGNVLGSNGSVVPLFQAQIEAGGPVTVTHPEVRRYFMTVREAVQLVLQASAMGKGAEIFVLDMGEPIRIVDLARNMIRMAGLVPEEDIEIRFVGLRPGEKLYEELMTDGENVQPTYHDKIKIFNGPRIRREFMELWLVQLRTLLARRDEAPLLKHLQELVPEYHSERIIDFRPVVDQRREHVFRSAQALKASVRGTT